jgi:CRP/FNR family transcriptional regulator, anaerobic regulatory protein
MSAQILQIQSCDIGSDRCRLCPTRSVCLASEADESQLDLLPQFFEDVGLLAPGDHIYRSGDPAQAQYHVRSGMVKTYVINSEGDEYVTGFYLPGEIIGHVHIAGAHGESAVALETTTVCRLDEESLTECAQLGLATALYRHMAANSRVEMQHQINLKQTSAQARVAGFLVTFMSRLERLGRSAKHLPTPMSRTDLASYLGMTLESLSRVISKFQSGHMIRASKKEIEILQPQSLLALGLHVNQ